MDIVVGVIVGLIVLMFLVTAHEFGHFVMARRNGVRVVEFGIGFPPRAIAWVKDAKTGKWRRLPKSEWGGGGVGKTVGIEGKGAAQRGRTAKSTKAAEVGDTAVKQARSDDPKTGVDGNELVQPGMIFSINWLPIGGFCQMDGESAEDTRPGTFGHANFWRKTKILFGGVAANWLVAFIIFTVLAWTGMPTFLDGQFTVASDTRTVTAPVEVTSVAEGSPAEKAGFAVGDKIMAVNGAEVTRASEITEINQGYAGSEVAYTVLRACKTDVCAGTDAELVATLNPEGAEYLLGITMATTQALSYSTWSAPVVGAGLTLQLTGETFAGLGQMVWNLFTGVGGLFSPEESVRESGQAALSSVGESVSGPVGIIGVLFPSFTAAGPANLAFLAALISVSLACMNVLPIPALDGGRWLLIAIYKLRRKKLTKETEGKIVSRAMMVLLAIMLIVTILDITRFF